jgi:hypothetical protein
MNDRGDISFIEPSIQKEVDEGSRQILEENMTQDQEESKKVKIGDTNSVLGRQLHSLRSSHKRALRNQGKRGRKKGV